MGQENIKLNGGGIKPMKRERTTNRTRGKLENMSYGQTVARKEQCQMPRRPGLDMGMDREGAHGGTGSWEEKNGEGEKRKGT